MTNTTYYLAWIIYLSAGLALNAIAWKLLANWRSLSARYTAISATLVLTLTPYFSDVEQGRMAPAVLISLFEFVFGSPENAIHAATPLLILLPLVLAVSAVFNLAKKHAS